MNRRIVARWTPAWTAVLLLAACPLLSLQAQQTDDLLRERREYAAWLATAPLSPYALLRIQPVGNGISIGREPADIPLPGIGRGMAREEGGLVVFQRDSGRLVLPRGRPVQVGAFTLIASGQPGRTVIVGWMSRVRSTRFWPGRSVFCWADSRKAATRSFSLLPIESSVPTPNKVASAIPLRICQV